MKKIKYPEAIIELRPSKLLKGEIGVFSLRTIKKNSVVAESSKLDESLFVSWKDYEKIDSETKKVIDKFCLGNSEGFYSPVNINYLSIPWNFNHSCDGSIGFDKKGNFIAIRDIMKDEELTYDYGLAEANPSFKMNCMCKSKNCRKIITGNDHLDIKFLKQKGNYLMPELIKK